jgi:DNA-binding NarL/FixJ family response regulator
MLVDDQKKVLSALHVSLQQQCPDWTFIEIGDLSQMWQAIKRKCPDLLVVDWGMRGLHAKETPDLQDGENPLQVIRRRCPAVGIIVLASSPEVEACALNSGANAFVSKVDPPETLLIKIREWQDSLSLRQEKPHVSKS